MLRGFALRGSQQQQQLVLVWGDHAEHTFHNNNNNTHLAGSSGGWEGIRVPLFPAKEQTSKQAKQERESVLRYA